MLPKPLPTRAAIDEVLEKYVEHIGTMKMQKAALSDIDSLREAIRRVCSCDDKR